MRPLTLLLVCTLLCSFSQADPGFDIQLDKGGEGFVDTLERVLDIRLNPLEAGTYRISFSDTTRREALETFFGTMPYSNVVHLEQTRDTGQALYTDRTLLRVRLAPDLSASDRSHLSSIYLTSFWTMRGEASGGLWTVVPTPKGVPAETYAAALRASPMIQEVALPLERTIEREARPGLAPDRKD